MSYSKATTGVLMAQAEIVAKPYEALAAKLAAHGIAEAKAVQLVGKERSSTWDLMKSAVKIAHDSQHGPGVMRAGLEIACVNAEVPAGTYRGYMSTVENLAADVAGGVLSLSDALAMSVKDARQRYKPGPTEMEAAKARLMAAINGRKATETTPAVPAWTAEQVNALAAIAEDTNAAKAASEEVPAAQAHVRAA